MRMPHSASPNQDQTNTSHPLYIGIDGGGSKTACVALTHNATDTQSQSHTQNDTNSVNPTTQSNHTISNNNPMHDFIILSQCEVDASNYNSVGKENAKKNIQNGIKKLIILANEQQQPQRPALAGDDTSVHSSSQVDRCHYTLNDVHSIVLSMSGCNNESDSQMIEEWVFELFHSSSSDSSSASPPSIKAYNDAIGALVSGTNGRLHGIACISGTGQMTWGNKMIATENNSEYAVIEHVAGGNGCLVDGGSGFHIGIQVCQSCFQHYDGMGAQTAMYDTLMKRLNLPHINKLVSYIYNDLQWSKVAALASIAIYHATTQPDIAQAKCDDYSNNTAKNVYHHYQPSLVDKPHDFQMNDSVAYDIIQEAIQWLVRSIVVVIDKLQYNSDEDLIIVLEGGIHNHRYMFESVAHGVYHEMKKRSHEKDVKNGDEGANRNGIEYHLIFTRPRVKAEIGAALLGYRMSMK